MTNGSNDIIIIIIIIIIIDTKTITVSIRKPDWILWNHCFYFLKLSLNRLLQEADCTMVTDLHFMYFKRDETWGYSLQVILKPNSKKKKKTISVRTVFVLFIHQIQSPWYWLEIHLLMTFYEISMIKTWIFKIHVPLWIFYIMNK